MQRLHGRVENISAALPADGSVDLLRAYAFPLAFTVVWERLGCRRPGTAAVA